MEFFKTDVLRKEFEQFQKEVLSAVLNCVKKLPVKISIVNFWFVVNSAQKNNVKRVKSLISQKMYYLKALKILQKNMLTILYETF